MEWNERMNECMHDWRAGHEKPNISVDYKEDFSALSMSIECILISALALEMESPRLYRYICWNSPEE